MPISEVFNCDCLEYMRKMPDALVSEKEWLMNHYQITRDGRVFRKIDGKEFYSAKDNKGYLRLRIPSCLSKNQDGRKTYKVHRLVAMIYLPNYSESLQVNHINGIKTDNRVENLEMISNRGNALHAWRTLDKKARLAKLNRDPVSGRFIKRNRLCQ